MVSLRWPNGVICPHCAATEPSFLSTRNIWKCKACHKQFSVKVGTIFEDSPLGLDKWLPCLWMIANCKNGISSYEVARALGVTQKTGWFMLHRIRLAMQTKTFRKMGGGNGVEIDETFIGGKARNMHSDKKARVITATGPLGKVAVMGLLERTTRKAHSRVRVSVIKNTRKANVLPNVYANIKPGTKVYTDSMPSYENLSETFIHGVIDHSIAYVDGKIHTNGLENFWSLLKRAVKGTYVSVEPFHLFRYLDEQAHRFNNRKDDDRGRFLDVLRNSIGRRLTYKALTGATLSETC
jgi:transposase-like protein